MKIKNVEPMEGLYVDTDEPDYHQYIRYGNDNWMVLMGESYERCYHRAEELENLFQEYVRVNAD
jgi:hypothetical protein